LALGLSTENLVVGLICLDFLTLTKGECIRRKRGITSGPYMLSNKLEITPSSLLRSEGEAKAPLFK
jgi:hypothetical protein